MNYLTIERLPKQEESRVLNLLRNMSLRTRGSAEKRSLLNMDDRTTALYEFLQSFHTISDNGTWITGIDDTKFDTPESAFDFAKQHYGWEYDADEDDLL